MPTHLKQSIEKTASYLQQPDSSLTHNGAIKAAGNNTGNSTAFFVHACKHHKDWKRFLKKRINGNQRAKTPEKSLEMLRTRIT